MIHPATVAFDANLVRAWVQACDLIARQKAVDYVLVTGFGEAWEATEDQRHALDYAAQLVGAESPSSVASVLLPRIVRLSEDDAATAIENGQRMFGRGRRKGLRFSGWRHTYFERLTGAWYDRLGTKESIKQNRVLQAIEKMNLWDHNVQAAIYVHTNLETETFRTRGSPCLQYVQFRASENSELSLVGMYRSHDYVNKALGNFIGLHDLGQFVAKHTGRRFVGANIVSLNPFITRPSQYNDFAAAI